MRRELSPVLGAAALIVVGGWAAPARAAGVIDRASVATGGAQGNGDSLLPSISAGGRRVAFASQASNLVPGDANDVEDVFVRDREARTTVLV